VISIEGEAASGAVACGRAEEGLALQRGVRSAALPLLLLLIAGCAGTGAESPPLLMSAPGESALVGYVGASHQTTLTAGDKPGNRFVCEDTSTPGSGTTEFNGAAGAYSRVLRSSIVRNGVTFQSDESTEYYRLHPYALLGQVSRRGTPFAVVTRSYPFPATLHVGDSGPVADATFYHDATMTTVDAQDRETYAVVANDSTTLLLCLNSTMAEVTAQGTADGVRPASTTEADCYAVDAQGAMALVSIALTDHGMTWTLRAPRP
jgi:hypothetical protein